jgi:hypothetical protein
VGAAYAEEATANDVSVTMRDTRIAVHDRPCRSPPLLLLLLLL